MNGGTAQQAFDRIDSALARLESMAGRLSGQPSTGDGELRERHERLRVAVSESLRQLDTLLAAQAESTGDE